MTAAELEERLRRQNERLEVARLQARVSVLEGRIGWLERRLEELLKVDVRWRLR